MSMRLLTKYFERKRLVELVSKDCLKARVRRKVKSHFLVIKGEFLKYKYGLIVASGITGLNQLFKWNCQQVFLMTMKGGAFLAVWISKKAKHLERGTDEISDQATSSSWRLLTDTMEQLTLFCLDLAKMGIWTDLIQTLLDSSTELQVGLSYRTLLPHHNNILSHLYLTKHG